MDALASFLTILAGVVAGVVDAMVKRLSHEPHPETIPGFRGAVARWAQDHKNPRRG